MTDVSNQSNQGPAPAPKSEPVAPASVPVVTPAVSGDVTPPVPVVEAVAKPITVGEPAAPAIEAPTGEADDAGVVVYDTTGDPGMDMALSFVGKLGLLPTHPAMVKASEGDFSFIKAHLASIGDKAIGWEQHIALAEQAYGNNVQKAEKLSAEITKSVHAAAGSPEQWAAIETWAKANASEQERKVINQMLSDNPVSARAATIMLRQSFEGATGNVVKPANPLKGNTPNAETQGAGLSPLSPKEYGAAVSDLNRRKPGAVDRNDPEYKQLQQRALAYRKT